MTRKPTFHITARSCSDTASHPDSRNEWSRTTVRTTVCIDHLSTDQHRILGNGNQFRTEVRKSGG